MCCMHAPKVEWMYRAGNFSKFQLVNCGLFIISPWYMTLGEVHERLKHFLFSYYGVMAEVSWC